MIRLACPRCKAILQQPDSMAGTAFSCPSCGQRLHIPLPPEMKSSPDIREGPPAGPSPSAQPPVHLAPPPVDSSSRNPSTPPPLPPLDKKPRAPDPDYDEDDDEYPSIAKRRPYRGRYSRETSVRAASSGFAWSLISMGMLLISIVLWFFIQAQHNRFGGDGGPLILITFLVILGSFILALLGIVFSSRGLDESNNYNRGQATAGLICGIIALVISCIVGLIFLCLGMLFWSVRGW